MIVGFLLGCAIVLAVYHWRRQKQKKYWEAMSKEHKPAGFQVCTRTGIRTYTGWYDEYYYQDDYYPHEIVMAASPVLPTSVYIEKIGFGRDYLLVQCSMNQPSSKTEPVVRMMLFIDLVGHKVNAKYHDQENSWYGFGPHYTGAQFFEIVEMVKKEITSRYPTLLSDNNLPPFQEFSEYRTWLRGI